MFSEIEEIDLINVLGNGILQVRLAKTVLKDGVEIAKTYHRSALNPGDDLAGQDPKVIAIAQSVWTPEVIAAAEAARNAVL